MILIAYDGSDDAKAAIEHAGKLFPGQPVTVLTVWQRFIDTLARVGGGIGVLVDFDEVDRSSKADAEQKAAEGAALAESAGLHATPLATVANLIIADTILAQAAAISATVVICGTRGYTGVKSLMLGSVSQHMLHHADRPVLVVPSPEMAKARPNYRLSIGEAIAL